MAYYRESRREKYLRVKKLFEQTAASLTDSGETWKKFLRTAANVSRYPFREQVLIFAQKPDSIACASAEVWNRQMGNWVKKGTHGIALMDDDDRQTLKYVFDVENIVLGDNGRFPFVWINNRRHDGELGEALAETVEEVEESFDAMVLPDQILSIASVHAREMLPELMADLKECESDADFIGLDAETAKTHIYELVRDSVAYMLFHRLGLTDCPQSRSISLEYVRELDLNLVHRFGESVSRIADGLIRSMDRSMRRYPEIKISYKDKLAKELLSCYDSVQQSAYKRLTNQGGTFYDRGRTESNGIDRENQRTDHISLGGGLPASGSDLGGRGRGAFAKVRDDEAEVHEGGASRDVYGDEHELHTVSASSSDPGGGGGDGKAPDQRDDGAGGADRGDEEERLDNLRPEEESNQGEGRRNRKKRTHIHPEQVTLFDLYPEVAGIPTEAEQIEIAEHPETGTEEGLEPESAPVFVLNEPQKVSYTEEYRQYLDEVLLRGTGFTNGKERVKAFYAESMDRADRMSALKKEYGLGGAGWPLEEGESGVHGYDTFHNGIRLQIRTENGEVECLVSWKDAEKRIEQLILTGQYLPEEKDQFLTEESDRADLTPDVAKESAPAVTVTIDFSEHPAFYTDKGEVINRKLSFAAACELFRRIEEDLNPETGEGYYKTSFFVSCHVDGEDYTYASRYDLGDQTGLYEQIEAEITAWTDPETPYRRQYEEIEPEKAALRVSECERMKEKFLPLLRERRTLSEEDLQLVEEVLSRKNFWYDEPEENQTVALLSVTYLGEIVYFRLKDSDAAPETVAKNLVLADSPFRELLSLGEKLSGEVFAELEQSERMCYSLSVDLNSLRATLYGINNGKGGVKEEDRTDSNTFFEEYDLRPFRTDQMADLMESDELLSGLKELIGQERYMDFGETRWVYRLTGAERMFENGEEKYRIAVEIYSVDRPEKVETHDRLHSRQDAKKLLERLQSLPVFEEELSGEAEGEIVMINGYRCRLIDSWTDAEGEEYRLGASLNEYGRDDGFFYAEVEVDHLEYDHLPSREEIEEAHLELKSGRALDEYEAEYGADGRRVFPHMNDEPVNSTDLQPSGSSELQSARARLRANLEAIRTLKQLEQEKRPATEREQKILAAYSGFGGLKDVFLEEPTNDYRYERSQLRQLLDDREYRAAEATSLDSFYTDPAVIEAIYRILSTMNFSGGTVLEPSMGIGNFFASMPDGIRQNSRLFGVELDDLTGRMAKMIYPDANITIGGFQDTSFPDHFFDLVIGNVPFGDYSLNDPKYNKYHFLIHDYFLAKAINQVRPGGIVALITTAGTMDKQSSKAREYYASRAELLGAIRLPNGAFDHSGTKVLTDILFFQKREMTQTFSETPSWVNRHVEVEPDRGVTINAYFGDHPDMLMGTPEVASGPFGPVFALRPDGRDLAEAIVSAGKTMDAEYLEAEIDDELEEFLTSCPADPSIENYSFGVIDDTVYYRENSLMRPVTVDRDRIRAMIDVREALHDVIEGQLQDCSDEELAEKQNRLQTVYDSVTKEYGLLSSAKNRKSFGEDGSYYLLSSLENLDENGKLQSLANVFTTRTIRQNRTPDHADSATEALALNLNEYPYVNMKYLTELTGKSEEEVITELSGVIFQDPADEVWKTADEYLSGNIRKKLREAREAAESDPKYLYNVSALEAVQPKDLDATEIDVHLGAAWIPVEDIKDFMSEVFRTPGYALRWDYITVSFNAYTSEWRIGGQTYDRTNAYANTTFGTERMNPYRLLEDCLNLRQTKVYDTVEDEEGNTTRVLNQRETVLAGQKQDAIKEAFENWIFEAPERRIRLCAIYNERFNSSRPRTYDGSHLLFPGINSQIELYPHQKDAVARVLYGGNSLLAYVVGAGKTFSMTAAAMEMKRLGLCNKSLFVVPNHLTEQWGSDFMKLYPSANILVATKKDFEPARRKRFCARIATGNYDAVIIGHSQFEKIRLSTAFQREFIEKFKEEISEAILEEKSKGSGSSRQLLSMLQTMLRRQEERLERLLADEKKDHGITFEQLGIDHLFVDESHYYKNLYTVTKMSNISGISTTEAQKSTDMLAKCQYLNQITGGRGVTFATGTPISNSMTEMYTNMRYLMSDRLKEMGLGSFDAWAGIFGKITTEMDLAPEGETYRAKTKFDKFQNLPELMNLFRECADIRTSDMLDLNVPEAVYEDVVTQPSEYQKAIIESLGARAEVIHAGGIDPSIDNMLKITSEGRKVALDQRTLNPLLPDEEGSKINQCVELTYRIWEETKEKRSTQLIFSDLSTPGKPEEFNIYDDIRNKLVQKGIPKEEIVFIHEAKTEKAKDALFEKVRQGKVRVLMGSTLKMGAGTNVQDRLIALHHLDVPWRPSDIEQREGRMIRNGNTNAKVTVYRYITAHTFDAYSWQTLENKQRFISQIMTSKTPVRSCDDVDESVLTYAEVKALAVDNPYIKEKMTLDVEVAKLKLAKSAHNSVIYRLQDEIAQTYPKRIAAAREYRKNLEEDITKIQSIAEPFSMTIGSVLYTVRSEANEAITACLKQVTPVGDHSIGKIGDFTIALRYTVLTNSYCIVLEGAGTYYTDFGKDNVSRILNTLEGLPKELEKTGERINALMKDLEGAREAAVQPFPREEELRLKSARLSELNQLLTQGDLSASTESSEESEGSEERLSKDLGITEKPKTEADGEPEDGITEKEELWEPDEDGRAILESGCILYELYQITDSSVSYKNQGLGYAQANGIRISFSDYEKTAQGMLEEPDTEKAELLSGEQELPQPLSRSDVIVFHFPDQSYEAFYKNHTVFKRFCGFLNTSEEERHPEEESRPEYTQNSTGRHI